jgi:DNA helicase-2/ATP-dependent DNA helicase PcrA
MQIIAAAGSGKTEVVSQRVADLLADGVPATGIAFTFTERAAAELRQRIAERAEERLGRAVVDQLGGLFLDGVIVLGRADVILDHEGGVPTALAILDHKSSTATGADHGPRLQVYADAGRRAGMDVRGAYVHDLKAGARATVDIGQEALVAAEASVQDVAERLRARDFTPSPGPVCRRCEVRTISPAAQR